MKKETKKEHPRALEESVDYYLEHGRWVFTDAYLLRRGYCCQSGCRHCPYGFKKPEDQAKLLNQK